MAELVAVGAPALAVLCVVRILLLLRPPPGVKLPHPSKIGLPAGGLASPAAAHAALMGRRTRPWWKFW
jgi:hypothetical protein